MKKAIIILTVSLCIINSTYSQIPAQSQLETQSLDSTLIYSQTALDSILEFSSSIHNELETLEKILTEQNLKGWPVYYKYKTINTHKNGLADSCLYFVNSSLEYLQDTSHRISFEAIVSTITRGGTANIHLNKYNEALKWYQKGLELNERYPNQLRNPEKAFPYKLRTYIYSGIAQCHYRLGNDSLAMEYLLMTKKDSSFMKSPVEAVYTLQSIATLKFFEGNNKEAISNYKQGLAVGEANDYHINDHQLLYLLGNVYFYKNDIDSCVHYYKEANESIKKHGSGIYEAGNRLYAGDHSRGVKELMQMNLERNRNLLTVGESLLYKSNYDMLLSKLIEVKDFKTAVKVLEDKLEFVDDFNRKKLSEQLDHLEFSFQSKKKAQEINYLEELNSENTLRLKQKNIFNYTLISLLGLLFVAAWIIRKRGEYKAQYQIVNLQQRLLRSQMNPHFVFNALNSIGGLLHKKSEKAIPYLNNLAGLMRLVLENSREDLVELDDEIRAIKHYLELESNFSSDFEYNISFDDLDSTEIILPPMLIQPFIENCIKHGLKTIDKKGQISVTFKVLNKKFIKDNGKWISGDSKIAHKSVSSKIVNERLSIYKKKYNSDCKFEFDTNESGTVVSLYLPYKDLKIA